MIDRDTAGKLMREAGFNYEDQAMLYEAVEFKIRAQQAIQILQGTDE